MSSQRFDVTDPIADARARMVERSANAWRRTNESEPKREDAAQQAAPKPSMVGAFTRQAREAYERMCARSRDAWKQRGDR